MSTIVSPDMEEEENTPTQEAELFPWRLFTIEGQTYTSRETNWSDISSPEIIDGHIFHVTTVPVFELLVELPARDARGPAIFALRPPNDTPIFSFKRLAQSMTPALPPEVGGAYFQRGSYLTYAPKLLYVAYGFMTEYACMQVRLRQDALRIEPFLLPRPLSFPF